MAEQQRKIELQSPDDLQYLIANVKRAAKERIDKDLPPIEGEDMMRNLVEEIVDEYISKTFHTASHSISINGMTPTDKLLNMALSSHSIKNGNGELVEEIEEHEPFDPTMWEKAKVLATREQELVEEIATLRRSVPGMVVQREGKWKREVEEEERWIVEKAAGEREEQGEVRIGAKDLVRWDEVVGSWGKGVSGLEGLKRGLPEVGARKERAVKAEEYVRGTGRSG